MAPYKKQCLKKTNNLITNNRRCTFQSQFGEPSTTPAVATTDADMHSVNSNKESIINDTSSLNNDKSDLQTNGEKNNNKKKLEFNDEICTGAKVSTMITDEINVFNTTDSNTNITPQIPENMCEYDITSDFCDNWELIIDKESRQDKQKYKLNFGRRYNKVPIVDLVADSTTLECSSSEDESSNQHAAISKPLEDSIKPSNEPAILEQPNNIYQHPHYYQSTFSPQRPIHKLQHSNNLECPINSSQLPSILQAECHHKGATNCKQCESITTAADAFQLYFKDKLKKDAEEIDNCILPRKLYKPAYRSGAYAILVALLEQRNECPYRDCLNKEELIQKAQKHTDQSFTSPRLQSNYTAWTNAKRLINKGMIQITNCKNKSEDFYMLTAMGRAVAAELVKEHSPDVTINDVIFHGLRNDRIPIIEEEVVLMPPPPLATANEDLSSVFIEMPPGTFDIVMLIDKREHIDINIPSSPNNYCKYESRSLNIGDFLWVARSKKTGQELVLPYIVERKTMDDLSASIKDGRYHEQKFRLRKCGLKTVFYIVENNKKNKQPDLPLSTLTQAMNNVCVQDEFSLIKSCSLEYTFKFLGLFSNKLVHTYLPLFLRGCNRDTKNKELMTFEYFNKFSCKNKPLTVRDTFLKMLLQLSGLSIEKALAITNEYSTPRALMKAYERCTESEGELLLAKLKFNQVTNHVGPAVSKTIYKLFSKLEI